MDRQDEPRHSQVFTQIITYYQRDSIVETK